MRRLTFARTRFSKKAFVELRGACVNQGGRMPEQFLELEDEIDNFASGAQERSIAPDDQALIGNPNGLLFQLDAIEAKAKHLRKEAVAGMERAKVVIAEAEPEDV
jgi:hypothetical protein